jgi:hypothetical protein
MPGQTATHLVAQVGQSIRIYSGDRLLATAVRTGRGWGFIGLDGHHYESVALDGVLAMLGALPDHHRGNRGAAR